MKTIVIKYGLRAGIVMILLSWGNFFITQSMSIAAGQIGGLLAILIGLVIALRSVKALQVVKGTEITFWEGFFTSALSSAIAAILMFGSTVIFMFVMGSAYQEWASQGIGDNAVIMHPVEQGVIMFIMVLTLGSLMSLGLAVINYMRHSK